MEWTVRAALQLPVDGVFVSTDGKEIADHARSLGATVIDRPAELAGDTTTTEDVLVHAINHVGATGIGILMEATQPIKDVLALKDAYRKININKDYRDALHSFDSIFLAHQCPLFVWDNKGSSLTYEYLLRGRTQTMKKYALECGDYLFWIDTFLKHKNRICGRFAIKMCNRFAQLDIDDPEDLRFINAIAREFNLKPAGL